MEKEVILFEKFDLPVAVHHLYMDGGKVYRGMHAHKAIEIVEVNNGILNCQIGDGILELRPGQVILINSNIGHRLFAQDAEISYLNLDVSLLEEKPEDDAISMLHAFISHTRANPFFLFDDNQELTEILGKIKMKYFENARETRWYLKAYLYELVAFMYARSFLVPTTISGEQIKKIEQVVRYVYDNFNQPITLDDICASVRYNKYTVCHTFKAATGATIFDYLNFVRVYHAVDRLRQKGSSILEVATACGFSSATYFNRVFKSFFGCSPSVYRKLLSA